jgi:hypothetical protein
MKRLLGWLLLFAILLTSLSSCAFLTDTMDEEESFVQAEQMLLALSEKRTEDATLLMHPAAPAENMERFIEQMADYLDGRTATNMQISSVSLNYSAGTDGKSKEEQILYEVTLDDTSLIYVDTTYLLEEDAKGFTAFTIILGVW